ncbi:Ferric reductase like transmembrane component family protein [Candida albicans]|uniref:Ferric reductase like transmembrane component family protein n=1 Tax=Candida albicans TaxID=5476 RepID=A0A8H6C556_CANAX|nr:Ferric reductase like transmembrane component family protein [Candida albicans]
MKFFQLITFLLTFALIEASGRKPRKYSKLDTAMQACNVYIGKYGTVCASSGKKKSINWKCYCNQDPGFGTISDCLVRGYNNDTSIIDKFVDKCNMTESKFYKNTTESRKSLKPMNAYAMSYNNYNISIYYGAGLLGYWAGIFVIAILANLFRKMFPRLTNYCTGAVSNAFRKYILLPATFGKKKAQPLSFGFGGFFDGLVPTRLESLIITMFVLLTGFLSALHIHHVKDNPQYATKNAELGHLIADRTGILSAFLIPLLILFGGRNNFLQWLTGWDFATFIMYHRWISRIDVLLIIVHAITFTVSDKATGKYNTRMKRDFMIWGVVATICAGFILFRQCYSSEEDAMKFSSAFILS